jgi:holo-[acyl-carrier protein] synthase
MIYGIGTDIVEVGRIENGLQRHGRRFAAKEALVKALGTGFRHGISLMHISVGRDPLGKPTLEFDGEAANRIAAAGITSTHLSLADEREYAVAFVVLEGSA